MCEIPGVVAGWSQFPCMVGRFLNTWVITSQDQIQGLKHSIWDVDIPMTFNCCIRYLPQHMFREGLLEKGTFTWSKHGNFILRIKFSVFCRCWHTFQDGPKVAQSHGSMKGQGLFGKVSALGDDRQGRKDTKLGKQTGIVVQYYWLVSYTNIILGVIRIFEGKWFSIVSG